MQLLHWKKTKVFLKKFSLERSFVESGRRPASWIYGGLLRHQHLLVKHLLLLKGMTSMISSVSVDFSEKGDWRTVVHALYILFTIYILVLIAGKSNIASSIWYWSNCLFLPFYNMESNYFLTKIIISNQKIHYLS